MMLFNSILVLCLSAQPALTVPPDPKTPKQKAAVWISGDADEVKVLDGDNAHAFAFKVAGSGEGADIEPGGPWLGVQFGPVSKPMAAQLGLEKGVGQMVLNVAEGSPADQAGLQQYDVIVSMGGQNAPAEIGKFMSQVREFTPGQSQNFQVIRGGQRVSANVTVGERPENAGSIKYKYEQDLDEISEGRIFNRGGMLQKDDQGHWTFKGLNLKDMPDVWKALPDIDDKDFNIHIAPFGHGDGQKVFIQKSEGKSIRLEKNKDGQITVTTTTKENGQDNTTTKTYANVDELKAADPDSAKLLNHEGDFLFHWKDGDFNIPLPDKEQLHEHLMEAFKGIHGSAPDDKGTRAFVRKVGRARTSFEVSPDGSIRVTTRRGDDERVDVYQNADALKAAKPDLYKRFERLQERDSKGPKS